MKFVIMINPNKFKLNDDGTIAEYQVPSEAEAVLPFGGVIIPIADKTNVDDYLTGKLRLPIFNRSGLRSKS